MAPDGINAPYILGHDCIYPVLLQYLLYGRHKTVPDTLGLYGIIFQNLLDSRIFFRRPEPETQVLQLGFDLIKSQSVGKRGKKEVGLPRNFHLFVQGHVSQGTHVVQPVCQLDQ